MNTGDGLFDRFLKKKQKAVKKAKKEIMGGLFDYGSRAPSVPPASGVQEYRAAVDAWSTQSKRIKNCASSIDLMYKDITRLNLLLRFLKSPKHDVVLKARLFTCVDVESKWSKLLWKFGNNTVIRCDFVNIQSLPPLSAKDKMELSRPSHPHHTPGRKRDDALDDNENEDQNENEKKNDAESDNLEIGNDENDDDQELNEDDEEKKDSMASNAESSKHQQKGPLKVKIEESFLLGINEFYYLFLFLEDKLPELAAWLMQQSEQNRNNMLLRMLSSKQKAKNENGNDIIESVDDDHCNLNGDGDKATAEEEKVVDMVMDQMNEIEDENCIICFETLVNPVCLSCGHEFCKACIEDWQQQIGSGQECPICRCMIEQSQMWIKLDSEDLSRTQYMMDLLKFPFDYVSKFPQWKDTMVQ